MVHIIFNSEPIYNNTVTLTTGQFAETSTRPSNGRLYYEFTHENGTSYHELGFSLDGSRITVYPQGREDYLKIYYYRLSIKENFKSYQNIGFADVVKKHTIGLGFDTYSRIFTVYYEYQIQRFTILSESKETKVRPYIGVSGSDNPNANFIDTVSVNFGENEFKYGLPYGYLPLNKNNRRNSCNCHKRTCLFNVVIVTLMLVS